MVGELSQIKQFRLKLLAIGKLGYVYIQRFRIHNQIWYLVNEHNL